MARARLAIRRLQHVSFFNIVAGLTTLLVLQDVREVDEARWFEGLTGTINPTVPHAENSPATEAPIDLSEKFVFDNPTRRRHVHVPEVDCAKVMDGNGAEIAKAKQTTSQKRLRVDMKIYMEIRAGCEQYKRNHGFILHHLTKEEREFPIAMSLMLFKEFGQVEDLLRAIYRPQNYYCLHVDKTSDGEMHAVTRAFAACFPNIIVSRDTIDVGYGQLNLMTPEMICMYEVLKYKKWKYFINLTGQEFPTKTNKQMVRIFAAFNGANDVVTSPMHTQSDKFRNRFKKRGTLPHGIHPVKGSSHVVLSRAFVEFMTSDRRVSDYISFLYRSIFPEESFWTTLNNDPTLRAPGGFNGTLAEAVAKPWNARVKWWFGNGNPKKNCTGFYKRAICIFGTGDVTHVAKETAILANKFYWDYEPFALRCLQQWMYNRTRDEYNGIYNFNASYYSTLPNALKVYRRHFNSTA